MSNLFFWIIILSFLVPMALRMYRRSVQRRNQEQGLNGGYPGQPGGPGPGGFGPLPGQYPGRQNSQPRDGYTQQDYFSGGFRPPYPGQPVPPLPQPYPDQSYPGQPYPDQSYPGQPYPSQPYPGQPYPGQPYPDAAPSGDGPGRAQNPPPARQQPAGQQPPAAAVPPVPPVPPAPSAPQGFRARKLAELDQRYSDGELAMDEYMALRAEIMKG